MTVPFDSLTLRAVCHELVPLLVGARIQHVIQPQPLEIILTVRAPGRTGHLLVSCDTRHARVHMVGRRPTAPPSPPAFSMALRKHIEGGAIHGVSQVGFDRVLALDVRRQGTRFTLIAELMGRHSNLALVDEAGVVVDSIKHVTPRISRFRCVLPGVPYQPPPAPRGALNPFDAAAGAALDQLNGLDEAAMKDALSGLVQGMSPFLAEDLLRRVRREGVRRAWESLFAAASRRLWQPVVVRDQAGAVCGAYPLSLCEPPGWSQEPAASINSALDLAMERIAADEAGETARQRLGGVIRSTMAAAERSLAHTEKALFDSRDADPLRRWADLLLAAGDAAPVVDGGVDVPDLHGDGSLVRVPLPDGQAPRQAAETYYRRARRLARGVNTLTERRSAIRAQLDQLASASDWLETKPAEAAVRRREEDLRRQGVLRDTDRPASPQSAPSPAPIRGVRVIRTADGWDVLLGLNAEGNDALLKQCAPDDLWFHVRSGTSAHVAVRTRGSPDAVPHQVLRFAASLAARHSAAKHSAYVPVDYTRRKYVRRPKGAAHGRVTYRNERTIDVEPAAGTDSGGH